jgi:hypothetical protein
MAYAGGKAVAQMLLVSPREQPAIRSEKSAVPAKIRRDPCRDSRGNEFASRKAHALRKQTPEIPCGIERKLRSRSAEFCTLTLLHYAQRHLSRNSWATPARLYSSTIPFIVQHLSAKYLVASVRAGSGVRRLMSSRVTGANLALYRRLQSIPGCARECLRLLHQTCLHSAQSDGRSKHRTMFLALHTSSSLCPRLERSPMRPFC